MIPLTPGKTIGILGGGQLGRMLILAGRPLGYRFVIYDPSPDATAGRVADRHFAEDYLNFQALDEFANCVDIITFEFEGIPVETLEHLEQKKTIHPHSQVLRICQNRKEEKEFLSANNIPCAPFAVIDSAEKLRKTMQEWDCPAVLKTAFWGYDGKGQFKIADKNADFDAIWESLDCPTGVLEKWIQFQSECSVIVARNANHEVDTFPVAENIHENHILDVSLVPARIPQSVQDQARALACKIAEQLEVIGLLAVEFFVTESGDIIVNEMAPRPHNSGHFSMDACQTGQFEQLIRTVSNLPLGKTDLHQPVAMINLMGEIWKANQEPNFPALLEEPQLKLHLYDKGQAKPGRKMGHFNLQADDIEAAYQQALAAKAKL